MKKVGFIACLVLAATLAQAQIPGGNIFLGYSYSGGDAVLHSPLYLPRSQSTSLNGWEGSVEGKFLPWIGIVADLSGRYGSENVLACGAAICSNLKVNVKTYSLLVGPRVSFSVRKFRPFAHFLVGAGRSNNSATGYSDSDTSLATAIGGGLDYKLIPAIAWRLQGDELHTRLFGTTQNNFRFSTGLVIRF